MNEKRSNEAKREDTTSGNRSEIGPTMEVNRSEIGPTMEDLEVRLTALAMGEASDFERSQLEAMMRDRPELQVLFEQFKQLHASLITMDVSATNEPLDKLADADWKLSDERRSKLLAVISGEQPNPVQQQAAYLTSHTNTSRWNRRRLKWWGIGIATAASLLIGISWFQWRAFPMSVATSKSVREHIQGGTAFSLDMAEPAVSSEFGRTKSAVDETVRLEARYDQSQIMKQLADATAVVPAPLGDLGNNGRGNVWELSVGESEASQDDASDSSVHTLRQELDNKRSGDRMSDDSASGKVDDLLAMVDSEGKPAAGGGMANPLPAAVEPNADFFGNAGEKVELQLGEDVAAGQRYLWFDKKDGDQSAGGPPSVPNYGMSGQAPISSGALNGGYAMPSPQEPSASWSIGPDSMTDVTIKGYPAQTSPAKPQSGEAEDPFGAPAAQASPANGPVPAAPAIPAEEVDKQLKNRIDATANGWMESSSLAELPVAGKALVMPPQGAAVSSTTPRIMVEAEEQAQSGFDPDRGLKGIAAARPDVTLQIVDGMDIENPAPAGDELQRNQVMKAERDFIAPGQSELAEAQREKLGSTRGRFQSTFGSGLEQDTPLSKSKRSEFFEGRKSGTHELFDTVQDFDGTDAVARDGKLQASDGEVPGDAPEDVMSAGQGLQLDRSIRGDLQAKAGTLQPEPQSVKQDEAIHSYRRLESKFIPDANKRDASSAPATVVAADRAKKLNEPTSEMSSLGVPAFSLPESNRKSLQKLDELSAAREPFSTFSLHVSDVSFKLAAAALATGQWPDAAKVRIEEFVNAFDYFDPLPTNEERVACQIEQAVHPFMLQRNVLRISLRTSATGRPANIPLRLTLLLDNSGSMERPDRRQAIRKAFEALAAQVKPNDQVTLISFANQPRLLAERFSGSQVADLVQLVESLPSEGGTNLEAALKLAMEKASVGSTPDNAAGLQNRIVLMTDGAVNLGDANPASLSQMVLQMRDQGIAFDAAGISAHELNDTVLEALTRQGDGRYYLLDSAEDASAGFAEQIAGALRPAAKNVKVQVEFNPDRVGHYKLLGFEKHLLKQEDFRNDKVDAAEMAAAEAGVAMYQFEAKPDGRGDIGSVSVRFQDLATGTIVERRWPIPYEPSAARIDQGSPRLKLATSAAMFAAKLRGDALGETVELKSLADILTTLPPNFETAPRVRQLQSMINAARQIGEP